MRRRLDSGASLIGRPTFCFLDEPTRGIDPAAESTSGRYRRPRAGGDDRRLLTSDAVPRRGGQFGRPAGRDRPRPADLKGTPERAEGSARRLRPCDFRCRTIAGRRRSRHCARRTATKPQLDELRGTSTIPAPARRRLLLEAVTATRRGEHRSRTTSHSRSTTSTMSSLRSRAAQRRATNDDVARSRAALGRTRSRTRE